MDESTSTKQRREELAKKIIAELPTEMSKGQKALESLMIYRSCGVPVPDDVLRRISDSYQHFLNGKPVAGRPALEIKIPSPMTLGEAFGVADIKGGEKTALKRKAMAINQPTLVALFTGQGGGQKLSRSRDSKNGQISDAFDVLKGRLTISEIEDWLKKHPAKTRKK